MSRRRGRPEPNVDELLDAAYAGVPEVNCRGFCQIGCSSVAMTPLEQRRIAARHGRVLPLVAAPALDPHTVAPGGMVPGRCAALDLAGRCRVYDDRPMICRLYGATDGLPCPFGCEPAGGRLSERAGRLAMARVDELSRRAGATDMHMGGDPT